MKNAGMMARTRLFHLLKVQAFFFLSLTYLVPLQAQWFSRNGETSREYAGHFGLDYTKMDQYAQTTMLGYERLAILADAIHDEIDEHMVFLLGEDATKLQSDLRAFARHIRNDVIKKFNEDMSLQAHLFDNPISRYICLISDRSRAAQYDYFLRIVVHNYNDWLEWINKHRKDIDAFQSTFAATFESRFGKLNERYEMEVRNQIERYTGLIANYLAALELHLKEFSEASFLEELTLKMDASREIEEAFHKYAEGLHNNAQRWANMHDRYAIRLKNGDYSRAAEEIVAFLGSPYHNHDAVKSLSSSEMDGMIRQWFSQPLIFALPDTSQSLARYRKAAAVFEFLQQNYEALSKFPPPVSADDPAFANMLAMAAYLNASAEERAVLEKMMNACSEYAAALEALPNFENYFDQNRKELVADRLIAAEKEIRSSVARLRESFERLNGDHLPAAIPVQQKWLYDYLTRLKAETNGRINMLSGCMEKLAAMSEVHQTHDAEDLNHQLTMLLASEMARLSSLVKHLEEAGKRKVGTITEWAAAVAQIPGPANLGDAFETLAMAFSNFDKVDSADPEFLLSRCEIALTLCPENLQSRFVQAIQLQELGRYQEAEVILTDLCAEYEEIQILKVYLALNYEEQGNPTAAEAGFRELLTDTNAIELASAEAWLQFAGRQGSVQTVAEELRPLFAERGEELEFSRILANAYVYAEQWNLASEEWQTILSRENTLSNQVDYCSTFRDPHRCHDAVMTALSRFPDSAELSTQRAWALLNQGQIEEAGEILHTIDIQKVPWHQLSVWIQFARASNDSQFRPLEVAAIEGPEEKDILAGFDMFLQGHYEECLTLLEKHPTPNFPYLNLLKAFAHAAVGNHAEAEEIVNEIDRNYGGIISDAIVFQFLLQVDQGHRREARRSLDRIGAMLENSSPEHLFYQCIFETRFGWWWKAGQLRRDCDTAFASDLRAMQAVWMLLPGSVELYQEAGRPPITEAAMAIAGLGCVLGVWNIRRRRSVKMDSAGGRQED